MIGLGDLLVSQCRIDPEGNQHGRILLVHPPDDRF